MKTKVLIFLMVAMSVLFLSCSKDTTGNEDENPIETWDFETDGGIIELIFELMPNSTIICSGTYTFYYEEKYEESGEFISEPFVFNGSEFNFIANWTAHDSGMPDSDLIAEISGTIINGFGYGEYEVDFIHPEWLDLDGTWTATLKSGGGVTPTVENPTENWNIIIDDGIGNGTWELELINNSTITSTGSWVFDDGSGDVICDFVSVAFTFYDNDFMFTADGTAHHSGINQDSNFTLFVNGMMYNGEGNGEYEIEFAQNGWESLSGIWSGLLNSGDGVSPTGPINPPPNPPSNPNPIDNASLVYINSDLTWECTDPDDDPLTYDVYLGPSVNPPLINSGQSGTTFNPGTLNESTTYYWKIVAKDDHDNSTTGDIWEFTTRDDALFIIQIADLQENIDDYIGQIVSIEGVITIGSGVVSSTTLQSYIQDESERGIFMFDYNLTNDYLSDIVRGNKLQLTGTATEYNGVSEIINFSYLILETGIDINNYTIELSIPQAQNYTVYEGTFSSLFGIVNSSPYYAGGGYNFTITNDGNQINVRVWDSTGINVSNLDIGQSIDISGIIGIYNDQSQIVPGYPEDITVR